MGPRREGVAPQWLREGLAFFTPAQVHRGEHRPIVAIRQRALDEARRRHTERFVGGRPIASMPQAEVWINRPEHDVAGGPDLPRDAAIGAALGRTAAHRMQREPLSAGAATGAIFHEPLLRSCREMRAREHPGEGRRVEPASNAIALQAPAPRRDRRPNRDTKPPTRIRNHLKDLVQTGSSGLTRSAEGQFSGGRSVFRSIARDLVDTTNRWGGGGDQCRK